MSRLTQIRLDAITGSLTAIETAAGSVTAGTPSSGVATDLEGVFGHFAGAIKRITGAPTFTEQKQGHFSTDLSVSGSLTSTGSLQVKDDSGNVVGFINKSGVLSGSGNFLVGGNVVVQGAAYVTGNLKLMNSIGDEGGEIFLNKSVTNTTLVEGLVLDVYQNKFRIFESGGTNRGGYFDITGLSAGVGTNLAAGGGATPGGSDTYVQFNDGGGSFGGDAGLTYNKTTDSLTVAGNITGSGGLFSSDTRINGQLRVVTGIRNTGTVNQGFNNFTSNFNVTTQSFVGVDTSLGAYTGTLPAIAGDYIGRVYSIKDVGGLCGTTPFVITASSPNKIDGATELKINTTSGSVSLIAGVNGASYNWYIMSYT